VNRTQWLLDVAIFDAIAGRAVMAGHGASEDARERAYAPAIHLLRKTFRQE